VAEGDDGKPENCKYDKQAGQGLGDVAPPPVREWSSSPLHCHRRRRAEVALGRQGHHSTLKPIGEGMAAPCHSHAARRIASLPLLLPTLIPNSVFSFLSIESATLAESSKPKQKYRPNLLFRGPGNVLRAYSTEGVAALEWEGRFFSRRMQLMRR
jgi:hypothetical protein